MTPLYENLTSLVSKSSAWLKFSSAHKTTNELLKHNEIIELLLRVKNKIKTTIRHHDISHRQIGEHRSVFKGYGLDYEESRRYQLGDDPRYMNWQLSARTGQHFMKVFREERQPGVFIALDRRSSMRFGTQQRLKITQAARAAAIASFVAQENNSSVSGLIIENEFEWYQSSQNKQAIYSFIQQAARPAKAVFESEQKNEPNITDALNTLIEVLAHKQGSTIYLISDFHDLTKEDQTLLLKLSSLHDIKAIHIDDKAESALPDIGICQFSSNIKDNRISINTHDTSITESYTSIRKEQLTKVKNIFETINVTYKKISTSVSNIEDYIKL